MLIWQICAVVLILAFVVIAVLAFIEPGPLQWRSHTPRGENPEAALTDHGDERNGASAAGSGWRSSGRLC